MNSATATVRLERETQEAAAHKRKEEELLREERSNRCNVEIMQTLATINAAQSYETAYRIRTFIEAAGN